MAEVVKLHSGDPRAGQMAKTILDLIYARGEAMSLATVIGVLELVKTQLIANQLDDL